MSVMSNISISLNELLTQVRMLYLSSCSTVEQLDDVMRQLEQLTGQTGADETMEDDSVVPDELIKEDAPACEEEKPRTATLEEARPVLAEISRKGYRAEVKALLTKYGAGKLSDITDETVLGEILVEAEELGCQNMHI